MRWCQKKTGELEPRLDAIADSTLRESAERIARHLAEDGARVERLVAGEDAQVWNELRSELLASARSRVGPARAEYYADEAQQKIAIVLLTGTPPSRAPEQLRAGPIGPRNEYVFDSPLSNWARTIVINLIRDDLRAAASVPRQPRGPKKSSAPDQTPLERARAALPSLVEAIRELPPVQQSVMILTLSRRGLDDDVHDRLHELAPDLFPVEQRGSVSTDRDIAERLGTTPRNVTSSRSVARKKLAACDEAWDLLLEVLLPHRSTRPARRKKG